MIELEALDGEGRCQTVTVDGRGSVADALRALGYALPFDCGGRGVCGRCRAFVSFDSESAREVLTCQTPLARARGRVRVDVSRLGRLASVERDEFAELGAGVCGANEAIAPSREELRGELGVAVDLGTTTIVCALVSLATSRVLRVVGARNPQASFGRDVLARIARASVDVGVARLMRELSSRAIGTLVAAHLSALNLSESRVTEIVVAGNTTMEYLFSGFEVAPLGVAPFTAPQLTFPERRGTEFDWHELRLENARVRVAPVMSAFVGGDILVGLSRLFSRGAFDSGSNLLLDVGTNGEVVLGARGCFYATSTAAGPAFEGGEISQGSLAEPGAIVGLDWDVSREFWRARTLCELPARSVCGSGLVDALAATLDFGALDPSGRFARRCASTEANSRMSCCGRTRRFLISNSDSEVWLTQRDVRAAQLAVAAMKAGRRILREVADVAEFNAVYLAGGFGASVNRSSAARVGLIPSSAVSYYVGNSSLWGAVDALVGRVEWSSLLELSRRVEIVDLTSHNFTEIFTDALRFP